LPETALRAASRRPTTQPSAASLACSVAWEGEVAHGDVNYLRIDGKDGVAGSIPAGSPELRESDRATAVAAKSPFWI
jgi:hypothetical protein